MNKPFCTRNFFTLLHVIKSYTYRLACRNIHYKLSIVREKLSYMFRRADIAIRLISDDKPCSGLGNQLGFIRFFCCLFFVPYIESFSSLDFIGLALMPWENNYSG